MNDQFFRIDGDGGSNTSPQDQDNEAMNDEFLDFVPDNIEYP